MKAIEYLVVHCSATPPSLHNIGAAWIDKIHKEQMGWRKIGYHYVIKRDGKLEYGRDENEVGAHVKGYNDRSLGICLIGGVDKKNRPANNFTDEQFITLQALLNHLSLKYPHAIICGHRDFPDVKKDCPCFDVKSWWTDVNNKEAVKCQDTKHSLFHYLLQFLARWKNSITRSS